MSPISAELKKHITDEINEVFQPLANTVIERDHEIYKKVADLEFELDQLSRRIEKLEAKIK